MRSAAEFTRDGAPAAVHAPGGQLLQATDQAIGARRARVLLVDHDKVRAPVIASWLTQMGIETALVASRDAAALRRPASGDSRNLALDAVFIDANGLRELHGAHALHLIDLRSSAAYRTGHAAGARWSIRPRLLDTLAAAALSDPVVLFADTPALAALAALNLREAGFTSVSIAANGVDTWMQAGLPLESSPSVPEDHERIDYLSFVHDRHGGNLDAARAYLAWETGLIAQCAPDELGHFRLDAQASEAATAH